MTHNPTSEVDKYIVSAAYTTGETWTVCELTIEGGAVMVAMAEDVSGIAYPNKNERVTSRQYHSNVTEYVALTLAKEKLRLHLMLMKAHTALQEKERNE